MDVSDAPSSQGIMLAFLPTNSEWCKTELPHMTLVYAGTIDKRTPSDFSSLAKDAATVAMLFSPFVLPVIGLGVFGDEEKVDVLRFRLTPELLAARRIVEKWNASQHSFKPHVTIGPAQPYADARDFPRMVRFDKLMVGWGDEQLTFTLNNKHDY